MLYILELQHSLVFRIAAIALSEREQNGGDLGLGESERLKP